MRKTFFLSLAYILEILVIYESKAAYLEAGVDNDYQDNGKGSSGGNSPILLQPEAIKSLNGDHPIYISPELEDIIDQQNHDVYHEEVHGTIIMPRIKFRLNDDDNCLQKSEDYSEYANIVADNCDKGDEGWLNEVKTRPPTTITTTTTTTLKPVPIWLNPAYNPTIEEMMPYGKIRGTKDTFIVMADDPVLVVDKVPKCLNNTNGVENALPLDNNVKKKSRKKRSFILEKILNNSNK